MSDDVMDPAGGEPPIGPDLPKPTVDWDHPDGIEPEWPTDAKTALPVVPKTHVCDGCNKERAVESFEVVDTFRARQYHPLVRCAECRAKKPAPGTAYDDRALTTT